MTHVEIYSTPTCSSCLRAKHLFSSMGIEYNEIDVSLDRTEMIERTNGGTTVPQIIINGEAIGGFDNLVSLERTGRLREMLGVD